MPNDFSKQRMSPEEFQAMIRKHNDATSNNSTHRGHPESALQQACVRWFRSQYPWPHYLITAVPNGGYRKTIEAKILIAEGVWSGIPDLYIPMARKGYTAMYIEMKAGKAGRVSQNQQETMGFLTREGAKCIVCRDFETFVREVNDYLR